MILALCEAAARAEGFSQVELGATMGGKPLYEAAGYQPIELLQVPTPSGVDGADPADGQGAPTPLSSPPREAHHGTDTAQRCWRDRRDHSSLRGGAGRRQQRHGACARRPGVVDDGGRRDRRRRS